jgi:hypothetical protein
MSAAETTVVAGIVIPSTSPFFLTIVAFHVMVGLACVVTGVFAMLSPKRRGWHPRFGTMYYWCLVVVVLSASALASMRWQENYHLFVLGVLAFAAGFVGRTAMRRGWPGRVQVHLTGMAISYIVLLTAFYVDNGENLPLWKELPPLTYWLLPGAVGLPVVAYALVRYRRHGQIL